MWRRSNLKSVPPLQYVASRHILCRICNCIHVHVIQKYSSFIHVFRNKIMLAELCVDTLSLSLSLFGGVLDSNRYIFCV